MSESAMLFGEEREQVYSTPEEQILLPFFIKGRRLLLEFWKCFRNHKNKLNWIGIRLVKSFLWCL